jgi:hypothetical protein
MRLILATLVIAFAVSIKVAQTKEDDQPFVAASFCDLMPSEDLMQANTSFGEVFRVDLDDSRKPLPSKRISGHYIELAVFDKCVQSWTFRNFPAGSRINVALYWKHGEGWTPMYIWSKGFTKDVKWR